MAPPIVIVGPYLIHNFGDDLIGSVFARYLQTEYQMHVLVPGLALANCEWLGIPEVRRWHNVLHRSQGVLIGGGGILAQSPWHRHCPYLRSAFKASVLADIFHKPVIVSGVGAGDLVSYRARWMCRRVGRSAKCIGVRDEASATALSQMGIPGENIVKGADVAFCWPQVLEVERPLGRGRVGLQFDPYGYMAYRRNPQMPSIEKLMLDRAATNAADILFLSNSRHPTAISRRLRVPATVLTYTVLPDYLKHLQECRVVITTHLHLAVAAYAAKIPCFSLYVMEKTKRFYEQIGHPERAIDLALATPDAIQALWRQADGACWTQFDEQRLCELQCKAKSLLDLGRLLRL